MTLKSHFVGMTLAGLLIAVLAPAVSAQVTGSGTTNYIPKWTGATNLGNSQLFESMHMGFGTATPNFAGYGGDSRVLTINSPGGVIGLGVVELTTDRPVTNGMEIGDVASSIFNNNLGSRRLTRVLTIAAGNTAGNRGGHLAFYTKADAVSGFPAERMRITDQGNVGIGTSVPASKFTVAGLIHSTSGGFKFPDGTVQTTAGGGGASQWAASGSNIYNTNAGGVAIGTTNPGTFKLAVEGKIGAREVQVTSTSPFPDYVFEADYPLLPLDELESHVRTLKHLPGLPTAADVAREGINVGQLQTQLVEKIEELTLYVIDLQKANEALAARVASLEQ